MYHDGVSQDVVQVGMSVKDFAKMVGITHNHALKVIRSGEVPSWKLGGRYVVHKTYVEKYLNSIQRIDHGCPDCWNYERLLVLEYEKQRHLLNALENYKDSKSFYKTLTKRFKRTPVKVTFKSFNGE